MTEELFGLPKYKSFNKHQFERIGVYATKENAEKDARRWKYGEVYHHIPHIVKIPRKYLQEAMGFKYALYICRGGER